MTTPTKTRQTRAALEVPKKEAAAAAKATGFKLPKTLAECADRAYKLREARYALQKQVDALANEEAALTDHLIENLPRSEASGVRGKLAAATIKDKEIVVLGTEDMADRFERLHDYILRNARRDPGVWSLLQRRVGESAVKELIEAGKGKLIGATLGKVKTVSLTKV